MNSLTNTNRLDLGLFQAAIIAFLVATTWTEAVNATADGPDYFRVTGVESGDMLNIRIEPNAQADKIGEIPPGSNCVRNLGCQGGLTYQEFTDLSNEQQKTRLKENPRWCRIEYQETTGWVAGHYLAEGDCTSNQEEGRDNPTAYAVSLVEHQRLSVKMESKSPYAYFNIDDVADRGGPAVFAGNFRPPFR